MCTICTLVIDGSSKWDNPGLRWGGWMGIWDICLQDGLGLWIWLFGLVNIVHHIFIWHRIISNRQKTWKNYLVDTVQYPVDKFTKLRCPTYKNMMKSIYQIKLQTRSVTYTNVPIYFCFFVGYVCIYFNYIDKTH
jgi:hypothetical protein